MILEAMVTLILVTFSRFEILRGFLEGFFVFEKLIEWEGRRWGTLYIRGAFAFHKGNG
jgi:hypothetical protein